MTVVIEDFRPRVKNTLRGFARARFPSGMVIAEIGLHVSNGRAWAAPPSRHMVDSATGMALRDSDGKFRWQPLITFEAVHLAYPSALRDAVPETA